jgi:hypothetical protein
MGNKKRLSKAKKAKLVERATFVFGSDESIIKQFETLGLPTVTTMMEAIEILSKMWINLTDFVNGDLIVFKSKAALINYTKRNRKYFPKKEAKSDGLSHLLVKMNF